MPEHQDNSGASLQSFVDFNLLVVPLGENGVLLVDLVTMSVTRLGGAEVGFLSKHTNFPESEIALMSVQLAGRIERNTEQARAAAEISKAVARMNDEAGLPPGTVVAAFTGPTAFMVPVARGVRSSGSN